jgi:RimJ/RimL family protein N-acetyltransferase
VLVDHWPLFGLRVTTPRLELRLPSDEDLAELADLAADGMHHPDRRPFFVTWPSLPPAERARTLLQRRWLHRGTWSPDDWSLELAVFVDGRMVGEQDLSARDFPVLRQVSSFSWLGVRHQGQGIGTEMRAAMLHLAFAGLGAAEAVSGAFDDNVPSLRVSEKLGYAFDGIDRAATPDGRVTTTHRLRLPREQWEATNRSPVTITGLAACRPLFGLSGGLED